MALLTAEDVREKQFSKTKYREGFDQDEVDDFLDTVADSIEQLTVERDRLRTEISTLEERGPDLSAEFLRAATDTANPPSPQSMLAMAQKLHDEYVRSGQEEKERIIFDAKSEADRIKARAEREAQDRLQNIGADRAELERKIDDLRRFERDYRARLKTYLENLLGDLDHGTGKDRMPNTLPSI
ncbi:MAG: DivIVA domain-containing protein [Demequinaceae bacterium]|nr:DivIVA domain-containing protein [Demequinaceae bacterium]